MTTTAKSWDWPLQHNDGFVNITNTDDLFEADLEMPSFKANEIDVKVMKDELVIHCSQPAAGGGRMPREVHRVYHLPPGVDAKSLKTSMAAEGILKVRATKIH